MSGCRPSLGRRLHASGLARFLGTIEQALAGGSEYSEHAFSGIVSIISGLNIEDRASLREWPRSRGEEIRRLVANSIDGSADREDFRYLIDQWMLGLTGLSYYLYSAIDFVEGSPAQELFAFSEERLSRLEAYLNAAGDDRRWTLELLKVLVREIPSWSEAVERVAPREQNQLVRRAFEICSETHHRDAVASLFADFVAGRAPDDELPLFVLLDAADLQRHWHEVVQLMKSDNIRVVLSIGDEIMSPRFAAPRPLTVNEIDDLLNRVVFWNRHPTTRLIWFARDRTINMLAGHLNVEGAQHLISRANDVRDADRSVILGLVLPRIPATLVTTDDLTEESCQIMLNEFLTNKSIDAFISSPGTIATERYIERHVLPSRK